MVPETSSAPTSKVSGPGAECAVEDGQSETFKACVAQQSAATDTCPQRELAGANSRRGQVPQSTVLCVCKASGRHVVDYSRPSMSRPVPCSTAVWYQYRGSRPGNALALKVRWQPSIDLTRSLRATVVPVCGHRAWFRQSVARFSPAASSGRVVPEEDPSPAGRWSGCPPVSGAAR